MSSGSSPCSCKVKPLPFVHADPVSPGRRFAGTGAQTDPVPTLFPLCAQNNVAGARCDECKPGFFHLSGANPDGCLRCFCMGVTKQCASSTWSRDQASWEGFFQARDGRKFLFDRNDPEANVC